MVIILSVIAGLMIGFMLSAILKAGVETDLRVALLLVKEENKELRSQLHTTMLNGLPYECGNIDDNVVVEVVKENKVPDLIDLGPDHDGPLRFIPYYKG